MKKYFSSTKGITVIGLIVTLVIMVILIGIVVNGVKGDEGVVKKAQSSKEAYSVARIKEKIDLFELKNPYADIDITDMIIEGILTIDEAKIYYKDNEEIDADKIALIKTAEEFAKIGTDENYPLDGYYILENDIDLSSICSESKGTWTPIANYRLGTEYIFRGIFNGNNHRISGLYINSNSGFQALFGGNAGIIKNTVLMDGQITGIGYLAGFVAWNEGVVSNCKNENSIISNGGSGAVGGVVASSSGIRNKIKNCSNTGDINMTSGAPWTGGVVGRGDEYTVVENCFNSGNIVSVAAVSGVVGGEGINKINNCQNTGNITTTGEHTVTGIVKCANNISYCSNEGRIINQTVHNGGIAGICRNGKVITFCYNKGYVEGYQNVGGIAAFVEGRIAYCYNAGDIKANYYTAGGIAGWAPLNEDEKDVEIKNCFNSGDVWARQGYSGGILGSIDYEKYNVIISNCYSIGEITCDERDSGGIQGGSISPQEGEKIKNNFYLENTSDGGVYGTDLDGGAEAREDSFFKQDENIQTSVTYLLNIGNGEDSNVWGRSNSINNGYPYLKGMEPK